MNKLKFCIQVEDFRKRVDAANEVVKVRIFYVKSDEKVNEAVIEPSVIPFRSLVSPTSHSFWRKNYQRTVSIGQYYFIFIH